MNGPAFQLVNWIVSQAQAPKAAAVARAPRHSLWEGGAVAPALAVVLCFIRFSGLRHGAACVAMVTLVSGLVVTFTQLVPGTPAGLRFAVANHVKVEAKASVDAPPPGPSRDARSETGK